MGETTPHVSISSWEVEDRHVVFNITTMPSDGETYSTKRRYREFERLNKKLEAKSLPKLNLPGKLFVHSDSAIEGRRVKLEKALKSYVQSNGLNPLLEDFLAPRSDVHLHSSRRSSMQDSVAESIIDDSMLTTATKGGDDDPLPDMVGSPITSEEEEELLNKLPVAESVTEADPCSQGDSEKPYQVWAMEMLAARASLRAERSLSLRLARIYTLATVATLIGSYSLRTNRWPLIGAALGSAVSAGYALLNALWLSRKEDRRRRGFGLTNSPSKTTDGKDVQQLMEHLAAKGAQKAAVPKEKVEEKEELPAKEEEAKKEDKATTREERSRAKEQEIDETLLNKLDEMHLSGLHDDVVMVLRTFDDVTDSRLAWRWARALYYQSQILPDATLAGDQLESALATLRTAAEKDVSALTHKWIAIVHNAYGERKGTIRDRVEAGLSFEFHTKRALEIDPNDPTLHYMSGRFCFDVSGLSWLERQGAKAIAGKEPPKATYEDALRHYEKALSLKPSPAVQLEIGRCYQKLNDEAKAIEFFKQAAEFAAAEVDKLSVEEEAAIDEAKAILKTLGAA